MAAMLHARNNTILFLWDKMFILMLNIFIVPGMQHGRHAKPLWHVMNYRDKKIPCALNFWIFCEIMQIRSVRKF